MRVLIVNKFYYLFGGTEKYLFNLAGLLESMGHSVVPFSMDHEKNEASPYARYFVSKVDLSPARTRSLASEVRAAGRILYSFEAKRKLEALIADTRPDVAHVRNVYHQLSPSVLSVPAKMGIPSVLTVGDYKLVCPNYDMFHNSRPCDACKLGGIHHAVLKRCVRGSLGASMLLAAEAALHGPILGSYRRNIDVFIAPSEFVRATLVEAGFPPDKVVHLPHFCDSARHVPSYAPGGYLLYFGRIDHRKGLATLIRAMRPVPSTLVIAGEGPERARLEAFAVREDVRNVRFVGHRGSGELENLIRGSLCSVLPSESNETFGHTILESFACGKPVVASRIGAIPELVRDGETGFLFEPGNAADLSSKLLALVNGPHRAAAMGKAGRSDVERRYGAKEHYEKLIAIYRGLTS